MRTKKYNFIPEHQLKEKEEKSEFTVTITTNSLIYIKPFDVDMWELNGKTIRLYADVENKTIAWKEVRGGQLKELENVRVLSKQPANQIIISVTKILKQMGVNKEMLPIKKIPVTEYKDALVDEVFKVIDLREYVKIK